MYIKGSDLRKMRLQAAMTTVKMAQFADVRTRKTYENWEKGVGSPTVNQFIAMATACGYSPHSLIRQYIERANHKTEVDYNVAALKAEEA
ncbi:helix-turn-helix transcriptional regulator [Paraneptunicella aestuarii]|nr:helix-turn-helix transcriptional regulator [Paraneptunicella aestuarii]